MKLSVIIVNYNVKYFLEQTLLSVIKSQKKLENQFGTACLEIFVVDNHSFDGSAGMVKKKFPQIKLIENTDNKGFATANNQAIKQSVGEYVLLLNPDTVVEELTLLKSVQFMEAHSDAGAMGVKMVDGNGNFLPESKRGLPTPLVAFYKIVGLSKLFPKSKIFARYYMGNLDNENTHEVDVLSGAFMLIRKKTLDVTGILDETFFMYGEDIDLSYRIKKAGYKNYYYPQTRIIHYKGESTKKSTINYVFVFYKAMAIFAKKHFTSHNAAIFSFLIYMAIYFRAGISVLSRIIKVFSLPVFDIIILSAGMYFLKDYWEQNHKYIEGGHYPIEFMIYFVPSIIIFWIGFVFINGGYDKNAGVKRITRGVITGTITILIIYALLPEAMRFSRALILLGSAWALVSIIGLRIILQFIRYGNINYGEEAAKRTVIVGDSLEGNRILNLLHDLNPNISFVGFIRIQDEQLEEKNLGSINQLKELVKLYGIEELIFCSKDISLENIIDWMTTLSQQKNLEYKIAPHESLSVIGSKSPEYSGNLYTFDFNLSITEPMNKRNKRFFDIATSMLFMMTSPIICWIISNKTGFYRNIFDVFLGKKSWVGYQFPNEELHKDYPVLPPIKKGVLSPLSIVNNERVANNTIRRLNMLYAKNYQLTDDIMIIFKGFKKLGAA